MTAFVHLGIDSASFMQSEGEVSTSRNHQSVDQILYIF